LLSDARIRYLKKCLITVKLEINSESYQTMAPARNIKLTKVPRFLQNHDPETGAFPDRPELEDDVNENLLASVAPFERPQAP
jgi:hypothetical protein